MAKYYPSLEDIKDGKMTEPVTAGEMTLLEQLQQLDDTYEVFFQSHINLSHPDIVVLKRGGGAVIIEVKDWKLSAYRFEKGNSIEADRMIVISENKPVSINTPFLQVEKYKRELHNLCHDMF